jgi:hypothetical protein
MKLRFYVYLLFLVTVLSCREEEPDSGAQVCEEDNSIGGMKEWFFFKPGSTWDYVEQYSGATDHVTVNEYSEQITNGGYYIIASYYSDYYQRPRLFEHIGAWMGYLNNETLCKRRLIRHTFHGAESTFSFNFSNGNSYKPVDWRSAQVLYSNDVGTSFVFDEIQVLVSKGYLLDGTTALTEIYIAKGVGIVRIKQPGRNIDWILTNYEVIQ